MTLPEAVSFIGAYFAGAAGAGLVLVDDRRALGALAVGYAVLSWFCAIEVGSISGLVMACTGFLVCGLLAITFRRGGGESTDVPDESLLGRQDFRVVAVLLVLVTAWGLAPGVWLALPEVTPDAGLAATFLLLLGLLQVSLNRRPLQVTLGLIAVVCGFQIAYSAVESSLAVLTLLVAVHLGLALVGSYLDLLVQISPAARKRL